MALFETVILLNTRALQPLATAVGAGTLYSVTDEGNVLERSNGLTWDNYGPTVSTSTSGNAATATALQTPRTINGVSFNGTANITVPAAAGTLTGATLAAGVLASSLTSVGTLATLTVTAAIAGSVTGNAATATALQTGRAINGTTFDGTAPITITAAAGTLTGGTLAAGVTASSLTSVGTLATLTVTAAIVGSVTGNAATATALATPRAINGVNFDGTAPITVTAAAGTLTGATLAAGVLASSLTSVGTLATLTVTAAIVGSVTGASGSTSGNAATATALATARAINGVNFDGTAPITVTAAAGTLTGATLAAGVLASSLTSVGTLATLTVTATITGSITGNAATATALATGRAINGTTFDGTAAITVTAAAGTLTGATLNATVTASSLTSLGTITSLAASLITVAIPAIATTTVVGVSLINSTAAALGAQQNGPALQIIGQGWSTTGSASIAAEVMHRVEPAQGTTATLVYTVYGKMGAGGYSKMFSATNTGNFSINPSQSYSWSTRSTVVSPADGQINFTNNATTIGAGFDFGTDAILKIRTRAQTGYATLDALGYRVSGVAIDTEPVGFYDAGNTSTALTLDWNNSRHQRCVLTGNVTFTLSNPVDGARYVIHIATGAGSFTGTWPAAVLWSGGTAPVLTATASKVDMIILIYNSNTSKYLGAFSQNY